MFDPAHVDYSPLTASVSPADVRAYRDAVKNSPGAGFGSTGFTTASRIIVIVVLVILFFTFGSTFLFSIVVTAASGAANPINGFMTLFGLVIVAIIVIAVISILRVTGASAWAKRLRLSRFGDVNGLVYTSAAGAPTYPGSVFSVGDTRRVTDHFVTPSGRFLDLGNYHYSTGSGKERTTRYWGFLALQLDRNMPNIVLDSKANNSFLGSNLPVSFSKDQVLSLEGDFDRYFTLYCPKEYEQDALYVLTPDLMALLIDDAAPFDVEIADSWIFFYSQSQLDMLAPATYERLFRIVQTVGVKAIRQTAHYVDDRVGSPTANVVATAGHRLRHGTNVVGLVVFIGFGAVWLFTVFHGFAR